jgi:hypothetical protein
MREEIALLMVAGFRVVACIAGGAIVSTATLAELSFVGLRLREPIALGRRFCALPKEFRLRGLVTSQKHGKGIVIKKTAMLRRVLFAKFSCWYPLNSDTAKELRRGKSSRVRQRSAFHVFHGEPRPEGYTTVKLRTRQLPNDCRAHFRLWSCVWSAQMPFDAPILSKKFLAQRARERRELAERLHLHEKMCRARFEQATRHMPAAKRSALRVVFIGTMSEKDAAQAFGLPYAGLRKSWSRLRPTLLEL